MNKVVFTLIILLLLASPATGAGCKEAVAKETQSWLEDCRAKCEKKLTCGCAVTAAFRKRAVYWPACLAAVASMKLSTVEQTWKGHWIGKGPDPEAPAARPGSATPDPDGGLFDNPPPQILANCEIGFSFKTEPGGTYRFWQNDASELKPSPWAGACIEGKSTLSRYQATGRGKVDFGGTGSKFTGDFRNGRAWNGQGVFWSKQGFSFEGELRNGEPWNGKETSRFAPEKTTGYRNGVVTKATVRQLAGHYYVTGTNPNGSRYKGTVTISRTSHKKYYFEWRIGKDIFKGTGVLVGKTMTVEWGEISPVVYQILDNGTLDGVWHNGRATETLVPSTR